MKLVLAPHNDDEGLFVAYTIMREHPLVIVVTDGYQHQRKFNIPTETRRKESVEACKLMGVTVEFMGLSDENLSAADLSRRLRFYKDKFDIVYAPALEGGNRDHDTVSDVAWDIWGDKVIFYSTYNKDRLFPEGNTPIIPTVQEQRLKYKVMNCYQSQIKINKIHFDSIIGRYEYYV